jgi:hypothetical protein
MTIERFLEVLNVVDDVERDLEIQTVLEGIAANLSNLVNSPGQPAQQNALATNLTKLRETIAELDTRLDPSALEALSGMGGGSFFDRDLANNISESVSGNAMTPTVARDFVQSLATQRKTFLENVEEARHSLKNLKVLATTLEPGTADVSFLIPRELFKNELESFSKELRFISKLFADYSEALTNSRDNVQLETLSSSVPTVVLVAALPVLAYLGDVVNKFLDAWKKVEEIREVRARVAALGIKGAAYNEFTKEITSTIERVVDEVVQNTIARYTGEDGRRNELTTAIKQDTKRLYAQIEQGLTIHFRASADSNKSAEEQSELVTLSGLGRTMEFPKTTDQPLLLSPGELLDDDADASSAVEPITSDLPTKPPAKAAKKRSKPS